LNGLAQAQRRDRGGATIINAHFLPGASLSGFAAVAWSRCWAARLEGERRERKAGRLTRLHGTLADYMLQ